MELFYADKRSSLLVKSVNKFCEIGAGKKFQTLGKTNRLGLKILKMLERVFFLILKILTIDILMNRSIKPGKSY
jgi:hypothetical protein